MTTTTDLIEQCRDFDASIYRDVAHANAGMTAKLQEAADLLEAQAEQIDRLQAALRQYSEDEIRLTHQSTIAAKAEQIEALQAERDVLQAKFDKAVESWRANETTQEEIIAGLQAKLSAIEAQEPHSWYSAKVDEWMTEKTRKDHARLNSHTHKVGGFDVPLYAAPVAPAQPPKLKCGVDLVDGVLTVTVIQAADDGVMEIIHSEQIEIAQPVNELVEALKKLVKAETRMANLSPFAVRFAQESAEFQLSDAVKFANDVLDKLTVARCTDERMCSSCFSGQGVCQSAPLVVNSEQTKPVVSQNHAETIDKAVQPLTKEQAEKVQKALALYRLPVSQIDISVLDEAIEIMKGVLG